MVQLCKKYNLDCLLLMIDFQKAFDRVDYNSLLTAMEIFNFGEKIRDWTRTLFKNFKLFTINNGYRSEAIFPTRGLFQGNPFSPTGFIIMIELLAIAIRKNKEIKGITINDIETLLSMFADDMSVFIENKPKIWEELKKEIRDFEHFSGLKVNYDKSSVYRLGSAKKTRAMEYSMKKLQWSEGPIKLLGIWITDNETQLIELNLKEIFEKAEKILNTWKLRGLSLIGSVTVLNTLISSLFVYKLSVLPLMGREFIQRYNNLCRDFVWQGKKPKIALTTLQGNKLQGGLGLTNIEFRDKSLKIQWISNIFQKEELKKLAYYVMNNPMGDLIWQVQLKVSDIKLVFGEENFWTDVLKAWCSLVYKTPSSKEQVREQVIWWNSSIKIDSKLVYYPKWAEKGIIKIDHLLNEKDEFLTLNQFNRKYNVDFPFTMYGGIISAIPDMWKQLLKSNANAAFENRLHELKNKKVSNTVYKSLCFNDTLLANTLTQMEAGIQY